ncbi:MAG: Nramp family divalent metal transporter, partial [Planctomycetaceae bacterium]|nr:Nramp family divalent metal transporter [Planctomycetaceae bacterium]
GGEWLFGPDVTARYGGGLMWIATVAIVLQVFYNIECGRYALYTGEPVFTGFMRTRPGPRFWICVTMLLSIGMLIPGLSSNAAVLIASMYRNRPVTTTTFNEGDTLFVRTADSASPGAADDFASVNQATKCIVRAASDHNGADGEFLVMTRTGNEVTLSGRTAPEAQVQLLTSGGRDLVPVHAADSLPAVAVADQAGLWTIRFYDDSFLVNGLAYTLLGLIVLPVLIGGKVYNMLQVVMTTKVVLVLSFCLAIGVFMVGREGWSAIFSGFLQFGNVPVSMEGGEGVANILTHWWNTGEFLTIELASIATLGAFAGYAGGGGLGNSTYSNFVRDKGWGMGSRVGAIASAIGGKQITLSHIGKVFVLTEENLARWKRWWKYILFDQLLIWFPGCVMGMALPALMSIEFSRRSPLYRTDIPYAQSLVTADGMRLSTELGAWSGILWMLALFIGIMVFLPSQISIVDDFARRWTDILWSSSDRVRGRMKPGQVSRLYYLLLGAYVLWSFVSATIFLRFGQGPKLMVIVIANLNNVGLGATSFHLWWINRRFLPKPLQPKWYSQAGILMCGFFYCGMALLVFMAKVIPLLSGSEG